MLPSSFPESFEKPSPELAERLPLDNEPISLYSRKWVAIPASETSLVSRLRVSRKVRLPIQGGLQAFFTLSMAVGSSGQPESSAKLTILAKSVWNDVL